MDDPSQGAVRAGLRDLVAGFPRVETMTAPASCENASHDAVGSAAR